MSKADSKVNGMKLGIFSVINKRISVKFSSAVVITIVPVLLLFSYYIVARDKKESENDFNVKISTISALSAEAFSSALWTYNDDEIKSVADGVLKDVEIAGIEVTGTDKTYYSYYKLGREYSNSYTFSRDISVERSSMVIGRIKITFSRYFVQKQFVKNVLTWFIEIVVLVSILIIVISIISLKITEPIKQLSIGADQIASGDLKKRILISSKDEVGELASKFNNMLISLNAAYSDIEKYALELEEKNKEINNNSEKLEALVNERTEEYNKANTELIKKNEELENTIRILQETQNYLIQSEKMASLGGLVAGVAHEINTPLGISISSMSFVEKINNDFRRKLADGRMTKSDLQKFTEDINDSIAIIGINLNRAAELIKNFKRVAVDQSSDVKMRFDLRENIEAVIVSLKYEYKNTNHKIHNLCPEKMTIYSYPGDFSQIITNFITNSLKHGFKEKENCNIIITAYMDNDCLYLTYSDDGTGISDENLKRIYEPFFTTNRHGGGSGLGLNIVYNIVTQKLKGSIQCESTLGKGVKFIIMIPERNINNSL